MAPGARCPTLVCFGATRNVVERLEAFREVCYAGSSVEKDIKAEPYTLFDLVVYGSFGYIDERVWLMCDKVYPIQKVRFRLILTHRNMNPRVDPSVLISLQNLLLDAWRVPSAADRRHRNNFALLHNCSKQITHLRETVDGFLLLVDNLRDIILTRKPGFDEAGGEVRKMLIDNLRHRRSLFNGLQLRLSSLQRRVDNCIGLEFNLVTLQDSMVMRRDASTMKIIAAITMVFLPTTAVASIVGSQIFVVDFIQESSTWHVQASPMFKVLWVVAAPLTLLVIGMSAWWNTLMERGNRRQSTNDT